MKLLSKTIIFCCTIVTLIAQNVNLDLRYEQAIKLTNADDALKIYEEIISSNLESDYVWLSKLKKAEELDLTIISEEKWQAIVLGKDKLPEM